MSKTKMVCTAMLCAGALALCLTGCSSTPAANTQTTTVGSSNTSANTCTNTNANSNANSNANANANTNTTNDKLTALDKIADEDGVSFDVKVYKTTYDQSSGSLTAHVTLLNQSFNKMTSVEVLMVGYTKDGSLVKINDELTQAYPDATGGKALVQSYTYAPTPPMGSSETSTIINIPCTGQNIEGIKFLVCKTTTNDGIERTNNVMDSWLSAVEAAAK